MNFDPLHVLGPLWVRAAVALMLLCWLAWSDWKKNGPNATRYKEYIFLIFSTLAAVTFAEVHDFVTVRISPEYFVEGKGLGADNLNWSVAKLAAAASYWVGLLFGVIFLVSNNPVRGLRRIGYRTMYRLMGLPFIGAIAISPVFGLWYRHSVTDLDPNFSLVWGIHTGSYFGGALGGIMGVLIIVYLRLRKRSEGG